MTPFPCALHCPPSSHASPPLPSRVRWFCHACHHANCVPRIDSVMDYLELSLAQLDSLVRCEVCLKGRGTLVPCTLPPWLG
jgi:hypothetical protein